MLRKTSRSELAVFLKRDVRNIDVILSACDWPGSSAFLPVDVLRSGPGNFFRSARSSAAAFSVALFAASASPFAMVPAFLPKSESIPALRANRELIGLAANRSVEPITGWTVAAIPKDVARILSCEFRWRGVRGAEAMGARMGTKDGNRVRTHMSAGGGPRARQSHRSWPGERRGYGLWQRETGWESIGHVRREEKRRESEPFRSRLTFPATGFSLRANDDASSTIPSAAFESASARRGWWPAAPVPLPPPPPPSPPPPRASPGLVAEPERSSRRLNLDRLRDSDDATSTIPLAAVGSESARWARWGRRPVAPVPPSPPPRLSGKARGAAREIAESELGSDLGLAPVLSDVRGEAAAGGSAARGGAAAEAAALRGREERCLRCRARTSFRRRRFCSDSGSTLSSTSTTHSAGQRAARIAVGRRKQWGICPRVSLQRRPATTKARVS